MSGSSGTRGTRRRGVRGMRGRDAGAPCLCSELGESASPVELVIESDIFAIGVLPCGRRVGAELDALHVVLVVGISYAGLCHPHGARNFVRPRCAYAA